MDAFSDGNFESAYNQFNELLRIYPKDPIYKYYSGVSLVKLENDPEKAAVHLEQAIKGSSVVKALPSDAFFYLGRAQQMSGKFTEAIRSYNLYTEQAGKRAAKEENVPQLIEQCRNKEGKIAVAATSATIAAGADKKAEPTPANTNPVAGTLVVKEAAEKPLPPEYSIIMDEALLYQHKADSLNALAEKKKKDLDKLPVSEQAAEKTIISETLVLAASFQSQADNKYAEADALMNGKRVSSSSASKDSTVQVQTETKKENSEVTANQQSTNATGTTTNITGNEAPGGVAAGAVVAGTIAAGNASGNTKADSTKTVTETDSTGITSTTASEVSTAVTAGNTSGTTAAATGVGVIAASPVKSANQKVEIFKYFEILPKPVTDPAVKIPIDPEIPAGLIYRIQIGAFRNPVTLAFFKGITPVYGFKSPSSGVTTYYVGLFRRMEDAKKALAEVRAKGFKDSFIVSQADGKTVSADRAAVLEKEWGKRPFATIGDVSDDIASDTIPPSLVFRVEAVRSLKPLKDDAVEELKKVAGSRGLDIQTLEIGNIVYLIGKFITFTSAAEYADLLIRNGYREAKVVAWLGKKEIPVDTARQLFENP